LEACIERQPDILLTEMQDQLREICGIEVSIATISRTIRRRGFTVRRSSLIFLVMRPAVEHDKDDRAAFKMLVGEHF
ncbi:hypothetical protein EV702DRAFT_941595, partial [Suillus placidus]